MSSHGENSPKQTTNELANRNLLFQACSSVSHEPANENLLTLTVNEFASRNLLFLHALRRTTLHAENYYFSALYHGRRRERRKELTCSARFMTNDLKCRNSLFLHSLPRTKMRAQIRINFFCTFMTNDLKCRNSLFLHFLSRTKTMRAQIRIHFVCTLYDERR